MKKLNDSSGTIEDWALSLPQHGLYTFTQADAERAFPNRGTGVRQALQRLIRAGLLVSPKHSFYVVVPLEYRNEGAPPAAWFIDALMRFLGQPYYAALLTAAEFHGAAHQRPQTFQVMTTRPIRPLTYGTLRRGRITWNVNKLTPILPTVSMNVPTGILQVSSRETTAFDLVRYPNQAGGYDNVATVLTELAEHITATALVDAAAVVHDIFATQRLGYILNVLGYTTLATALAEWLERSAHRLQAIPLRRGQPVSHMDLYDEQWHVKVNGALNPDI